MRKLLLLTVGLVLLQAGCATSGGLSTRGDSAVIQSIEGSAELSTQEDRWRTARPGQTVRAGATVRTAADSRVHFDLKAGGVLTLHPDSTLTFERIALDKEVLAVLNLTRGRVTGDTGRPAGETKIVVKTLGGVHEIQ